MLVDLRGTQFQICQRAETGRERVDELGLELAVDLLSAERVGHVGTDVLIETQRIADAVGVHAVAAHVAFHVEADALVDDVEHDRRRGAELVVHDLFGIEVIHALILARVAAIGETTAEHTEAFDQAVAEVAREHGRLGRFIIGELTGFRADLHDLALLHDDHALTFVDGNARSVGDDVVAPLGVGRTRGCTLLAFDDQRILVERVTVEKFFPLIGKGRT